MPETGDRRTARWTTATPHTRLEYDFLVLRNDRLSHWMRMYTSVGNANPVLGTKIISRTFLYVPHPRFQY